MDGGQLSGGPVAKTLLPVQGARLHPLVRGLDPTGRNHRRQEPQQRSMALPQPRPDTAKHVNIFKTEKADGQGKPIIPTLVKGKQEEPKEPQTGTFRLQKRNILGDKEGYDTHIMIKEAILQEDIIIQCCCCCSVTQSCPTLSDPMDCSTPGFPVLHSLPDFAQTHVH